MTARKNIWAGVVPALFFFILTNAPVSGQSSPGTTIQERSSGQDTLTAPDSAALVRSDSPVPGDTVPRRPLGVHGQMLLKGSDNSYRTISKENFLFQNYSDLHEILAFRTPAYPLHLGSEGQFNHFSFFGAMPREVGFRLNGRSINEVAFGAFNLEQMPPEMIDKLEIFLGTDAAVFGGNPGALINVRQNLYNINRPYTRLWYIQGGYDLSGSDGIFSQNFARDWNFFFGFRRLANNARYRNASLDNWNIRTGFRWAPTNRLTVTLSDFFTNHRTGTNGGVDPDNSESYFSELGANPYYEYMDERVFRHDLTLGASVQFDADSLSFLNTELYLSQSNWHKGRPVEFILSGNSQVAEFNSQRIGARAQFEQGISQYFTLRTGGEAEIRNAAQSDYTDQLHDIYFAGYGHGEIRIAERARVRGGMRIALENEKLVSSLGIATNILFNRNLSLLADISRSARMPSPSEGLGLEAEQHTLLLAELRWQNGPSYLSLNGFARSIGSPILWQPVTDSAGNRISARAENAASRRVIGATLNASAQLFRNFTVEAFLLGQSSTTNATEDRRFPLLTAKVSGQYEYRIGESRVIAGTAFTFLSAFQGEQFVPQRWAYVPFNAFESAAGGSWDVFLSMRLGNAFVRVSYLNILSRGYYFVPLYPQYDRNLRLSIAWSFFD